MNGGFFVQLESMVSIAAGPSQLIAALCDEIGLETLINEAVEWHPSYCKVSPGMHVKAMVINILCSRMPLYRVSEFYHELDVELLFGSAYTATDFNDDALARTLDRLYDAQSWKIYSQLALSVLRHIGLPLEVVHSDTTSFSLHGDYSDQEDLNITYGYNKDGRPDLKQIVIGLGVTPQRLPIIGKIEDGNTDDKTWNTAFITKLREVLAEEEWNGLTYVADSALATMDNVLLMKQKGLSFITRLPDTFSLSSELKEEAGWRDQWQDVQVTNEEDGRSRYRLQSFERELYGQPLRFVVVHSSHLEAKQQETLERQMNKEREKMAKALRTLSAAQYACEHDAQQAIAAFRKQHKWKFHEAALVSVPETYTLPRTGRGRPKEGEKPETAVRWRIVASDIGPQEEALLAITTKQGMFVLMTSHKESPAWTSEKILQTYKGQAAAETRFRLLKDPSVLNAIYLKQPSRIEALGTVFIMALLLYGLLEWRVRENLKQEKEPILLPGKRKSFTPTAEMLLAMLKSIQVIVGTMGEQRIRAVSAHVNDNVKRIVRLAGYDIAIYTSQAVEKSGR